MIGNQQIRLETSLFSLNSLMLKRLVEGRDAAVQYGLHRVCSIPALMSSWMSSDLSPVHRPESGLSGHVFRGFFDVLKAIPLRTRVGGWRETSFLPAIPCIYWHIQVLSMLTYTSSCQCRHIQSLSMRAYT